MLEMMPASQSGPPIQALRYADGTLWSIDQTRLPLERVELPLRTPEEVADAIRRLSIRGAPLIGVAGAYGMALAAALDPTRETLERSARVLIDARPTAADLTWGVQRVLSAALAVEAPGRAAAARCCAERLECGQRQASADMARHGADLLTGCERVLTHCNAGALAAPGHGTALAVIVEMAQRGRLREVIVDESRPLLQGARLTVLELAGHGVAHRLIVDSAAAGLILGGAVDAVIVGCDRVAVNGDVANKVGTVGLALAAQAAGIPFVVVGPVSTIDLDCPEGGRIVIEERGEDEVRTFAGRPTTLAGTRCRNPAFDVTPAALVSALVTERGVLAPVGSDALRRIVGAEAADQPDGAGSPLR